MDPLMIDIWGCILEFVKNNKDKCYLLMTCKEISKCNFCFTQRIHIDKIGKLEWFNKFTNIEMSMSHYFTELPISTTNLMITTTESFPDPWSVNFLLKPYIPSTVTHLEFDWQFNKPLGDFIPSSVTHLKLGASFNQPIENSIPSSVVEIMFGARFNQSVNSIPSSVKCLKFHTFFNKPINGLPSSVEKIIFRGIVPEKRKIFLKVCCPKGARVIFLDY